MLDPIARTAALLQAFGAGREPPEVVIAAVAKLVGSDRGYFLTATTVVDAKPFAVVNLAEESITQYAGSFAFRDVQLQALAQRFGNSPPAVLTDETCMPHRQFVHTELFNDFWRCHDGHRMIRVDSEPLPQYGLDTLRILIIRGSRGEAFGEKQEAILWALLPHLRAASLSFAQRRAAANASLAAAFEGAADAVLIIGGDGRLRYANAAFETLRRKLDGSLLHLWDKPLDAPAFARLRAAFQSALVEVRRRGIGARRTEFAITVGGTVRQYLAAISSILTTVAIPNVRDDGAFLIVIRESQTFEDERLAVLRRRFDLTTAQLRVLQELAAGYELRDIAGRLSVSIHTVRLHVKALLTKTDCKRQAQLVQLLERASGDGLRLLI